MTGPDAAAGTGLTLQEKASLCSGEGMWHTTAVCRGGRVVVPAIMVADGPHGLRRPTRPDSAGIGDSVPATCFPTACALGSSWDRDLCRQVGAAIGAEARAAGVALVLGPGVNIKRSPLCGRNFEYFSEDPMLGGSLAAAWVTGVQAQGVGTAVKHFAANNQETDRMRVSAQVGERPLREIYLAGFERVVTEARPWTVMCSYNRVNGVYASEHRWLLTEVLRHEWGFDGVVMSDWGAVSDRVRALAAGLDLEMPGTAGVTDAEIVAAVRAGRLDETAVDAAVARLVALAGRAAARGGSDRAAPAPVDPDAHHALARRAAAESAVLLKNDRDVLPIDRMAAGTVAVIGELARTPRYQGAGSSQVVPTRLDVPLDELRRLAGPGVRVPFAPGYRLDTGPSSTALVAEAVELARSADTVVVFVGLPDGAESEGFDRTDMELPPAQVALLDAVAAVHDRVAVVLANGAAVTVSSWAEKVAAVLEGWLPGQGGGAALAELLLGVASPSGRLAETIPLRLEHTPAHLNFPGDDSVVCYGEGLFVGYRWYDARRLPVAYPFGHGLTYTTFSYDRITATVTGDGEGEGLDALDVRVEVTVSNTGDRSGREVVQVYVGDPVALLVRPERELKAFAKVGLEPGQTRQVTFHLGWRDFSYYHPALGRWVLEPGVFVVHAGRSSGDLPLVAEVRIAGPPVALPLSAHSTLAEWLADPVAGPLTRQVLATSDGRDAALDVFLMAMPLDRLMRFPGAPLSADRIRSLLSAAGGTAGAAARAPGAT